jgi:hypothetical protein
MLQRPLNQSVIELPNSFLKFGPNSFSRNILPISRLYTMIWQISVGNKLVDTHVALTLLLLAVTGLVYIVPLLAISHRASIRSAETDSRLVLALGGIGIGHVNRNADLPLFDKLLCSTDRHRVSDDGIHLIFSGWRRRSDVISNLAISEHWCGGTQLNVLAESNVLGRSLPVVSEMPRPKDLSFLSVPRILKDFWSTVVVRQPHDRPLTPNSKIGCSLSSVSRGLIGVIHANGVDRIHEQNDETSAFQGEFWLADFFPPVVYKVLKCIVCICLAVILAIIGLGFIHLSLDRNRVGLTWAGLGILAASVFFIFLFVYQVS